MKIEREPTEAEWAELREIAARHEAGVATPEDLQRAFILEGYTPEWAGYLASVGGYLKQ